MLYKIIIIKILVLSCSNQEPIQPRHKRSPHSLQNKTSENATQIPKTSGEPKVESKAESKVEPKAESSKITENNGPMPLPPGNNPDNSINGKQHSTAQPQVNGLTSIDKCVGFTPNPPDCSSFCTVVVCGEEAGAYDGDLDGRQPIFRFKKKGDGYCGGKGKTVVVSVACRRTGKSQKFEFTNPGVPSSGAANRGSPYRWEKNFYSENGMLWKSAGDGGRPLVIILSKDFRDDKP